MHIRSDAPEEEAAPQREGEDVIVVPAQRPAAGEGLHVPHLSSARGYACIRMISICMYVNVSSVGVVCEVGASLRVYADTARGPF